MSYKPPLHIINKEQKRPQETTAPKERSEGYKITMFTLSYRIKGAMIGLAVAIIYCEYFLHYWSQWYILAGLFGGWIVGWLVGRFFYSSDRD